MDACTDISCCCPLVLCVSWWIDCTVMSLLIWWTKSEDGGLKEFCLIANVSHVASSLCCIAAFHAQSHLIHNASLQACPSLFFCINLFASTSVSFVCCFYICSPSASVTLMFCLWCCIATWFTLQTLISQQVCLVSVLFVMLHWLPMLAELVSDRL